MANIAGILDRPIEPVTGSKGILAIFTDEEALKSAARQVRERGVKKFDAFSPFPVHGIEEAMGLKRSILPFVTFGAGLTGGSLGLLLQVWTSGYDWALNVGGKPFISWLAFIPITFECTVLFAGLATAGALFFLCNLPKALRGSPTDCVDPRITNDHFAIYVSADDRNYRENELSDVLKKAGAHEVRSI